MSTPAGAMPSPMAGQMAMAPSPASTSAPTPSFQHAGLPAGPSRQGSQTPLMANGQAGGATMYSMNDEEKMKMVIKMDPAKVQNFKLRYMELQSQGHTRQTNAEMAKLYNIVDLYSRAKQQEAQRASQAGNAAAGPSQPPATAPSPAAPSPASNATVMTPQQIAQLRAQAHVNQLVSRNQPVPEHLMQAANGVFPPGQAGQPPAPNPLGNDLRAKVIEKTVDAVVTDNMNRSEAQADATGPEAAKEPAGPPYALEFDTDSVIYPYNAYTHPAVYAHRKFDDEVANPLNKMQRMVVPSMMPRGLDPNLLMEERNRYVETRMGWRMKELEEMDATMGVAEPGAKGVPGIANGQALDQAGIRARIELLSLRLVGKQKLLREDVVRAMHGATQVPADRNQFRRFRTHALRDARATETAERRQKSEREQRGKQRHLAYITSICDHGKAIIESGVGPSGSTGQKMRRLGKAMLKMHVDTEKEEQRRVEKLAKDRLKALKADDEEGYLALLDEAKDSRIGHLLKQTDSYLETLAAAITDQQNDDVHKDAIADDFELEDGPANEAMFGARRQDGEEDGAETKQGKVDYYAVAHRLQEKVTKQADMLTGGTLKDYQVKGLQWMISLYNNRLNGILADEMGLGKTIQTISLICYLIEKKRQPGPFLVIVPLSTLTNWTLEFERWAPTVRVLIMKGSPAVRKELYPRLRLQDFQVCLTTYEYIIKERPQMARIKWCHMIIDEGHRMKNVKSKLSQTLNEHYSARYRLILTGTPLQNNLPELWALLNFALPKIFNSVKSFDEWFSAPFANTGSQETLSLNEEEQLLIVKRLHKVLRPFLLRRLKKDVESELPDKVEKVIYTKMSGLQTALYRSVKQYKMLPFDTATGRKKGTNLQNALMQLRKICNHPFVFREVDEDFSVGNNIDEQIVRTAGKFELLDRLLPKLFKTGHKVLIFFQMTEIMTIIADFFDYRGWKYCRLDGSTKADDRQTLLSTFNDPNSPYQVFILSTRAGGLGLNLQSADTVIIYDTDWNPHADLQAQDRAHRIGQKKEVRVLRLITSKTVEELVLEKAQKKLELDGKVIQAGKFDNVTTEEGYEAVLARIFGKDAADEDAEETNELDDDELNELLARGDHELEIFAQMDREREAAKLEDWKAGGNKGPLPPSLMTEAELPPYYRRDIGEELAGQLATEEEQGRGRRAKAEVKYTDGLTDEQWINAMDASDDDVDEASDRKKKRHDKKAERKRMNEMLAKAEAEGKPLSSIKIARDEEDGEGAAASVGGAGESNAGTPSQITLTIPGGGGSRSKKRGRPSVSATPSVMGDDLPQKKRKTGGPGNGPEAIALMNRMYASVNALKSDAGEDLNTFFLKPVDKKLYPDYYAVIAKPIALSQIKRKIGQSSYSLPQFKADMHTLWDNARTYNQEDSWVYNAAEDMQEHFDRMWDEEVGPSASAASAPAPTGPSGPAQSAAPPPQPSHGFGGPNVGGTGDTSVAPSGTSTPMFKANAAKIPTKIKINLGGAGGGSSGAGGASRRKEVMPDPTPDQSESESEEDEDDDY